ncbi:MAG: phosphoribosyltransferase family protein [Actinomycetota bacterium]
MRAVLSNADLVRIGRGVKRDNPLVFPRRARVDAAMLPGNGLSAIHGGLPLGDRGTEAGVSAMAGGGAPLAATGESLGPFALAGPLSTHERPRVARLGNKPLAGIGAAEERPTLQQPTRPKPPGWPAPPQMGGTAATSMGSSAKQRPGAQLTGVYIAATAPLELEPYAATVVKGRKREEWAKALQREIGRLSQLSAGISEEIGRIEESNDYRQELRNPGLFRQYPERSPRERIQSLLAQIRGKDDDYRRNHGRPLPGTLNAQVEEIRRTLTAVTKADQARAAVKEVGRAPATSPTPAVTRPAPPGKIDALNLFPIAPPKLEQKAAVKVGEFIPASGVAQHERLSGAIRQAIAAGAIPAPPDLAPEGAPERKLQEQRLAKLRQVVEAYNTKLRQEHSFDVGGYRWGGPDEAAYVLNTTPWLELNARHGKRWNWQEFGSFAKAQGLGQLSDFDKKVLNAAINARRMEWLDKAVGKLRSEGEQVMEGALFVAGELFGMGAAPIVLRGLGIVGRGIARSAAGQATKKTVEPVRHSRLGKGAVEIGKTRAMQPPVAVVKTAVWVAKPTEAKVQAALGNMLQEGVSAKVLDEEPDARKLLERMIRSGSSGYAASGPLGALFSGTIRLTAAGYRRLARMLEAGKPKSPAEAAEVATRALTELSTEPKYVVRLPGSTGQVSGGLLRRPKGMATDPNRSPAKLPGGASKPNKALTLKGAGSHSPTADGADEISRTAKAVAKAELKEALQAYQSTIGGKLYSALGPDPEEFARAVQAAVPVARALVKYGHATAEELKGALREQFRRHSEEFIRAVVQALEAEDGLPQSFASGGKEPQSTPRAPGARRAFSSSRDVKAMRLSKDGLSRNGFPPDDVEAFVDQWYRQENYERLRGQDNVYLVMPSTTGQNTIPLAFAERLAKEFGGEVVDRYARPLSTKEAKSRGVLDKLRQPTDYTLTRDLSLLRGRNIIVVDDVLNTGDTMIGLSRALRKQDVVPSGTAVLGASEGHPASTADLNRLARRLAAELGLDYNRVRADVELVFTGAYRKYTGDLERLLRDPKKAKEIHGAIERKAATFRADATGTEGVQRGPEAGSRSSGAGVRSGGVYGVSGLAGGASDATGSGAGAAEQATARTSASTSLKRTQGSAPGGSPPPTKGAPPGGRLPSNTPQEGGGVKPSPSPVSGPPEKKNTKPTPSEDEKKPAAQAKTPPVPTIRIGDRVQTVGRGPGTVKAITGPWATLEVGGGPGKKTRLIKQHISQLQPLPPEE